MFRNKFSYILLFVLLKCSVSGGQSTDNLKGTWTVCIAGEKEFSPDYHCKIGFKSYNMSADGSYNVDIRPACNGDTAPFLRGKWKLKGDRLTLKNEDWICPKGGAKFSYSAEKIKIVWLDKNRFYTIGQEGEGGEKLFIVYERIAVK
jgi:hypothetical protein